MTLNEEVHQITVQWKHIQCELEIFVILSTPTGPKDTRRYYDITYKWNYDKLIAKHPMAGDGEFMENHSDGEIVVCNAITESLIAALVLNNDDLEKISGNTDADCYRSQIIKALSLFWD